jgi:mRNA interferase YafO
MSVRVFVHKLLLEAEAEKGRSGEIATLRQEFIAYKTSNSPSTLFGRDAPFDRPQTAVSVELKHVHLHDDTVKVDWLRVVQRRRVSNSFLVYCPGEKSSDNYLLIALLRNDPNTLIGAHERTRKITFMLELAEIAENFRKIY